MCHSLNTWEQQYEINYIYDEERVVVNFENECYHYLFILTSATQGLKISKTINLRLIV
jgi:hypothetical protein